MQETKPAHRYVVQTRPTRGGYRAWFAIPGHIPDYVRENGQPKTFPSIDAAELAALRAIRVMANDRLALHTTFEDAAVMTAEELSASLDELDISPTELARLLQNNHVTGWLGGERRVSHMAHIIVEIMKIPTMLDKVRAITAQAVEKGRKV